MDTNQSSPAPRGPADIPRSVLISGIGAIVLFISVFLSWYSVNVSLSGANLGALGNESRSFNGWDSTDVAKLVALLALAAIVVWAVELFATQVALPIPAWMVAAGAGGLSVLLVLYRIVSKPTPGGVTNFNFSSGGAHLSVDIGTSFGIYLALIAAVATVVGAYLRMQETA
jgi:hypothetical protein